MAGKGLRVEAEHPTWSVLRTAGNNQLSQYLNRMSTMAGKKIPAGSMFVRVDDLGIYGDVASCIATMFDLRGQETVNANDTSLQIPFGFWMPWNLLRWETSVSGVNVPAVTNFFQIILEMVFGPQGVESISKDSMLIIVDPHLLSSDQREALAQEASSLNTIVILPNPGMLPAEFVGLRGRQGFIEFRTSSVSSILAESGLLTAVNHFGNSHITVAGAGERLFPTILSVSDATLLNYAGSPDRILTLVETDVSYLLWASEFESDWFAPGTLDEVTKTYLESWDVCTDDIQDPKQYGLRSTGSRVAIRPIQISI